MTRLNKELRNTIVANVYEASQLPKEWEALYREARVAATRIFKEHLPEGFLECTKSLPMEWFPHTGTLYCGWIARSVRDGIRWSASNLFDSPVVELLEDIPYTPTWDSSPVMEAYTLWCYDNLRERAEDCINRRNELSSNTMSFLLAVKTTEKLLKVAPEFERFIPKGVKTFHPPALPVSNLLTLMMNAGIDLTEPV